MNTFIGILWIFGGFAAIVYLFSLLWRVQPWELRQRREGKSLKYGYMIVLLLPVIALLAASMIINGGEMLKQEPDRVVYQPTPEEKMYDLQAVNHILQRRVSTLVASNNMLRAQAVTNEVVLMAITEQWRDIVIENGIFRAVLLNMTNKHLY